MTAIAIGRPLVQFEAPVAVHEGPERRFAIVARGHAICTVGSFKVAAVIGQALADTYVKARYERSTA